MCAKNTKGKFKGQQDTYIFPKDVSQLLIPKRKY